LSRIPGNPERPVCPGLSGTARHNAINRIRCDARLTEKREKLIRTIEREAEPEAAEFISGGVPDERLRMIESIRVRNA